MSEEKFYIDAEALMNNVMSAIPYVPMNGSYGIEMEISKLVNSAVTNAFMIFASNLQNAIERSKKPYSQCMLCTRKAHDVMPPEIRS